ncbi:hypothetical protein C8R45DRAFT_957082 [Mycena sanguinolenta]|nr:hypothetical protein C8R45DRAFT_957082 [Mycena sanguinolenta]
MSNIRIASEPTDYKYAIPGAILMDGLLHSFCLGFVLALGLKYWEEYTEDSLRKRAFVLTVVFLSLLQTMLEDYKIWTVALLHIPWAASPLIWTEYFLNGAICSMCEAFYIRRCWKMTGKSPWVLYPMVSLWLSGVAAQFYVTITLGLEFRNFRAGHRLDAPGEHRFRDTIIVFSYSSVQRTILDIAVASIMITSLVKSKTGLDASNSVVNRVILLTLETALLPSISMVASLIVTALDPGHNDDLVMFFLFITAKFYAIGLLRTLNARAKLRQRIGSTDLGRTSLGNWTWDQDPPKQEAVGTGNPDPGVRQLSVDPNVAVRQSIASSAPTYTSQALYESVPHDELEARESPAARPSVSQHVHFSSPVLDQHERGSYPGPRLRVSSLHRAKPPNYENA